MQRADDLMEANGWTAQRYKAGEFSLRGYVPSKISETDRLAIYIEGDGASWIAPDIPPRDPTPTEPLMLRLALQDPTPNRLYLGRPCQYLPSQALTSCASFHWTSHRYAPEIVSSLNAAIEQRKRDTGAKELVLFGYSGGGALAVLLATERQDIRLVVTIAGNLDHNAWTKANNDTALHGSLNPADVANNVSAIPQIHFIGLEDNVMSQAIARSYIQKTKDKSRISVVKVADTNHTCCWVKIWPDLLKQYIYNIRNKH